MKVLLTSVMALGVVFMLGGNQPAKATTILSIAPTVQQEHVVPVYWYYGPRWHHRGFWFHRYRPYWRHHFYWW